jgi:hypothetical protein
VVGCITGFSRHPDGNRFLTSFAECRYDIWMFDGFDQGVTKTWQDRLLWR